jgi:signal transduction histidine kinase
MGSYLSPGGVQVLNKPADELRIVSQMDTPQHLTKGDAAPQHSPDHFEKDYTDFVDLAIHELDTPLRKLSVFVNRLTGKFDTVTSDQDLQVYIKRIDSCVSDMRCLIDDLSLLAKVRTSKLNYTSCRINDIVKEVLEELHVPIHAKKITVTVSSLPVLDGDEMQYRRLFKNLIENAIRFGKDDIKPEISIHSSVLNTQEINKPGLHGNTKYHKIEIADNGIGFKNEYAEKIFRPFVRLHGKSRFPGSGIGLAICRKVAENHHGIIYAEGRENGGARFILILPEIH